mgnify:CR=1 FL=1
MNWKLCPGFSVPESNLPSGANGGIPLVTECGMKSDSLFVHLIVVPTVTVMAWGLYARFRSETETGAGGFEIKGR